MTRLPLTAASAPGVIANAATAARNALVPTRLSNAARRAAASTRACVDSFMVQPSRPTLGLFGYLRGGCGSGVRVDSGVFAHSRCENSHTGLSGGPDGGAPLRRRRPAGGVPG